MDNISALDALIEPILSALWQHDVAKMRTVGEAISRRQAALRLSMLDADHATDPKSFELGVLDGFAEIVESTAARAALTLAVDQVSSSKSIRKLLIEVAGQNEAGILPSQRDIADILGEDPGNLNRQLKKLEAMGLLRRVPTDGAKALKISDIGIDILNHVQPDWRDQLSPVDAAARTVVRVKRGHAQSRVVPAEPTPPRSSPRYAAAGLAVRLKKATGAKRSGLRGLQKTKAIRETRKRPSAGSRRGGVSVSSTHAGE